MDFQETQEQALVRKMVREFATNEVEPYAAEIDLTGEFPYRTVEKMREYGLFSVPFPVEYGGAGGDNMAYAITIEELARVCASTAVILAAHTSLCAGPIFNFGNDYQKRKYLLPLIKGEKLGAFGLTEPNAGTDAAGQNTKAVDMGDYWLLNGTKVFITNGGVAETYVIVAMTDKSKGTRGLRFHRRKMVRWFFDRQKRG